MLILLYDILLLLLTPVIIPYHVYRSLKRGRSLAGFGERFGFIGRDALARIAGGRGVVWVHAVSVGETMAVKPLLRELKRRHPERRIVLSNMTETGRRIAEAVPEADLCIYFPFDYRFAAARALRLIAPSLVIIVETELWPGFLGTARRMGIPAVMVNGRISDRSFPRYLKLSRFFSPVLANVTAFCMQTDEDARRIIAIGAPAGRVHVARNLKYDLPVRLVDEGERMELRRRYRIPDTATVIVAGSTHPGEDEPVIAAYAALLAKRPELFLVLVPRHPERAAEVAAMLEGRGMPVVRRSTLDCSATPAPGGVLLVDTIGELMNLYALADLVFVGGSLVPTGGHNLLEPASVGRPVVFGPYMNNFREIAKLVLDAGAGVQVSDAGELRDTLHRLLDDRAACCAMGARGAELMAEQGGAAARHLEIIGRLLGEE
ncbi:MAG: 3-deoxy-D-manno-octulosonic acid transferase [Desulfuromonadales bacterium]|nr:MAG: 3-deoxy-D-manno-octulosonic acid transferase [Desulfuromonadales bacterium]